MMDKSAITVAVKIKPISSKEEKLSSDVFKVNKKSIFIKENYYSYDEVFPSSATNEEVFAILIANKIDKILLGYNVTILTYGQSGSGKTYTMGTDHEDLKKNKTGIVPLSLKKIFNCLKNKKNVTQAILKASFYEIYMETIVDLINPKSVCTLRGDAEDLKIKGLSEKVIENVEEAMELLYNGSRARKTDVMGKNPKSSRSHAIFSVALSFLDENTGTVINSKFQMIDLAGSERFAPENSDEKAKQGSVINKSLTTLGRVITSITEKCRHVPYRDSILTRVLQDSIGGNSYTVLIACITEDVNNLVESTNTLRYADNVKKIENTPIINKEKEENSLILKTKIQHLENSVNLANEKLIKSEKELEDLKKQMTKVKKSLPSSEASCQTDIIKFVDVETSFDNESPVKKSLPSSEACCQTDIIKFVDVETSFDNESPNKDLLEAQKEIENLKREIQELKMKKDLIPVQPKSDEPKLLPVVGVTPKKKERSIREESDMVGFFLSDAEESFASTYDDKDPDYINTPACKKRKGQGGKRKFSSEPEEERVPKKKTRGCSCPSSCSTQRCSCQKKHIKCDILCSCDKTKCLNKFPEKKQKSILKRFLRCASTPGS